MRNDYIMFFFYFCVEYLENFAATASKLKRLQRVTIGIIIIADIAKLQTCNKFYVAIILLKIAKNTHI